MSILRGNALRVPRNEWATIVNGGSNNGYHNNNIDDDERTKGEKNELKFI